MGSKSVGDPEGMNSLTGGVTPCIMGLGGLPDLPLLRLRLSIHVFPRLYV